MLTPRVIQTSANSAEVKAEVSTLQICLLSGWVSGEEDQLDALKQDLREEQACLQRHEEHEKLRGGLLLAHK